MIPCGQAVEDNPRLRCLPSPPLDRGFPTADELILVMPITVEDTGLDFGFRTDLTLKPV